MRPRTQVVLLDFDGTLAATHLAVIECARRTSAQLGHGLIAEQELRETIAKGLPLPETFAAVIRGLSPAQVAACVDVYRAHYGEVDAEHSILFDEVRTTVQTMHATGLRLVVLSNKGSRAIATALQRFELDPFIHCVLAAERGLPTKPDPALFDLRVAPLFPDLPISSFLMVGDTAADLHFAKSVGIRSCWARYGYGDPIACRELAPKHEIGRFAELLSILTEAAA